MSMYSACPGTQANPTLAPSLDDISPLPTPASMPEHAPVSTLTGAVHKCLECGKTCRTKSRLSHHGSTRRHSPFACTCGAKFSRLDVLFRHLKTKNNAQPQHPCPYCKRHRGKSAFHRKDHLKQHVEEYHKLEFKEHMPKTTPSAPASTRTPTGPWAFGCHIPECTDYRDVLFYCQPYQGQKESAPFTAYSEYTRHLKTMHETTRFPCPASGCNRVGAKGYQREKALITHYRSTQPDRPSYLPKTELLHTPVQCPYPSCTEEVNCFFLDCHVERHHSAEQQHVHEG
ncbi:hypothetical protein B0J13DRAFT_274484 [Dactylonectria estremocensis]|uniref:C2H2-type domain-containing protein n=1 Tax=Dactylonectria estremocensis TaxID=1079267 RepID=A0A9P9EXR5_9HYPO|nr:hypothetical protein B0J13DRAFT_274484 [Dactylonectria estremocensis]